MDRVAGQNGMEVMADFAGPWRSNLGLRGLVALPVLLSGKQASVARDDYGAGASRNQ
ncbi:MAG: hypothetical protein ACRD2H_05740 [Terriglobales bacterium]